MNYTEVEAERRVRQFMESCGFKAGIGTVGGFGFGALIGLFMASMNIGMPMEMPGVKMPGQKTFAQRQSMSALETVKDMGREMGTRAYSTGKNFALMSAIFAGSECLIESHRAKHDMLNSVSAGCFTGGVLGLRAGPAAGAFGCMGFAAFSAAIDLYMGH
ncbi:import inner membrane translocase subunit TIM22 [Salpingoeca rosetta]|uniref:Mitochondrial import inner membrane translocase subunit TIM22 n=1 Tax=Salpingoeca rosetta (strain ATCC 50818 / BSB-021) TaxID=946362 RepID=F2U323_SALR5|nr:import inner membrane translocase subunit TIM22 [Salpingoeca rosetta]EGD82017.1 import inner membrane translocase subunit TIM22 [Salpingoeca rosetta]|eukprot:XP_004996200.1 import inner membrane translocase subunit TIM22 [Salpingoeca rosetta]